MIRIHFSISDWYLSLDCCQNILFCCTAKISITLGPLNVRFQFAAQQAGMEACCLRTPQMLISLRKVSSHEPNLIMLITLYGSRGSDALRRRTAASAKSAGENENPDVQVATVDAGSSPL